MKNLPQMCIPEIKEKWNTEQAMDLCSKLEVIAPDFGGHVALTGGTLYKRGERKDVDILIYRIRQVPEINKQGLLNAFTQFEGVKILSDHGWCVKAELNGKDIDFFFPEEDGEIYNGETIA